MEIKTKLDVNQEAWIMFKNKPIKTRVEKIHIQVSDYPLDVSVEARYEVTYPYYSEEEARKIVGFDDALPDDKIFATVEELEQNLFANVDKDMEVPTSHNIKF